MATLEVVTARVVLDEAGAALEEELLEELLLVEPLVVLLELAAALGDEWLELELELPQAATRALRSRTASTVISGRFGFIEGSFPGAPEAGSR